MVVVVLQTQEMLVLEVVEVATLVVAKVVEILEDLVEVVDMDTIIQHIVLQELFILDRLVP